MTDDSEANIVSATIVPNSEVPTGTVYIETEDGRVKELYVSDVTKVEDILHETKDGLGK